MKIIAAVLVVAAAGLPAADNAATLWSTKVQPLLSSRCFECHGEKKAKHKLRLDSKEAILKGGEELGPAVIAGKPDESPLIKVCTMPTGDELAMPPKGERLSKDEIAMLKTWIAGGAIFDEPAVPKK